jgi:hypothetical protein
MSSCIEETARCQDFGDLLHAREGKGRIVRKREEEEGNR